MSDLPSALARPQSTLPVWLWLVRQGYLHSVQLFIVVTVDVQADVHEVTRSLTYPVPLLDLKVYCLYGYG